MGANLIIDYKSLGNIQSVIFRLKYGHKFFKVEEVNIIVREGLGKYVEMVIDC